MLIILYEIDCGINSSDKINYLFNMDFHLIVLFESVDLFLQLVAEKVACRYYNINADIVAPILVGLLKGFRCFLQHHCKTDSMHLINSTTNYL